jgi:predicted lipoprotein with Yx(FWY)xxD motif
MKAVIAPVTGVLAAIVLTACGGAATNGTSGSGSPITTTLAVQQLSGVGSVLVDGSGNALYTPDQEANGTILCTGACNAFWKPLTISTGAPSGPAGAGQLGVITRPDGSTQVTDNGKPLYTFSQDSPGNATGDGFADDFDGHHFMWHVVRSSGNTGGSAGSGTTNGSGSTSSSSSGYGY